MNDEISQIRALLDKLEKDAGNEDDVAFIRNFNALELPQLISEVVDYLQPNLTTYEAAIYWHLFRHCMLSKGQQYVRASVRGLMKGVVESSSGHTKNLSYAAVGSALKGLEDKRAISKAGDTNREGTLYKLHLPEEIEICQKMKKQANAISEKPIDTEKELDYYNVAENKSKIFERDEYKCYYCKKQLTRFSATLDHIQPVSRGGDNSYNNLVTSCLHCNSSRGNRPVSEIL
jgi:hypothetical protein